MNRPGLLLLAWRLSLGFQLHAAPRPNIVLVITDDQGYGDLGHTGNPVIKTPHLDRLAAESSNLTDYHVAPTCSPTRAALLTGHWTDRTGVWHTVNGRSMLRENEVTPGSYSISLRRWPLEADQPITAALPPGADVPGASKAFRARPGFAIPATSARLRLNGEDLETKPVQPGDKEVTFITRLTAGSPQLAPVFVDAIGNQVGAYYTIITKRP